MSQNQTKKQPFILCYDRNNQLVSWSGFSLGSQVGLTQFFGFLTQTSDWIQSSERINPTLGQKQPRQQTW